MGGGLHDRFFVANGLGKRGEAFFRRITAPVLLVRGARSPFLLPDHARRVAAFRTAREVVVPEAGHNVHHEQPQALLREIETFLGERTQRPISAQGEAS